MNLRKIQLLSLIGDDNDYLINYQYLLYMNHYFKQLS